MATDAIIKVDSGSGFAPVAGLRLSRFDVTASRAGLSGRGVFNDAAADALVRQVFFDGSALPMLIVTEGGDVIEGPFQITALAYADDESGETVFSASLESVGAVRQF